MKRNTSQRGAALIVGLVLMMVLTILAISTMRTATVELAMAGNTQYHQKARQLAEAGLSLAMDQIDNDVLILDSDPVQAGNWDNGVLIGDFADGTGDNFTVDVRYLNTGAPPAGYSQVLNAQFYELRSTGQTAARNARSVLVKGFFIFEGSQSPGP